MRVDLDASVRPVERLADMLVTPGESSTGTIAPHMRVSSKALEIHREEPGLATGRVGTCNHKRPAGKKGLLHLGWKLPIFFTNKIQQASDLGT